MAEENSFFSRNFPSRIPRLQRSTSFHNTRRLQSSPLPTEAVKNEKFLLEKRDELGSLSSVCSALSCVDWDYRKKSTKYALHCSTHSRDGDNCLQQDYLTPTQRANRTISELKFKLKKSEASNARLQQELATCKFQHKACSDNKHSTKSVYEKESQTIECQSENILNLTDSGLYDDSNQLKDSEMNHEAADHWSIEKRKLAFSHLKEIEKLKEDHSTAVRTCKFIHFQNGNEKCKRSVQVGKCSVYFGE